ncbi:MAG: helix-turn-helix domain-containing protein [Candidatus Thermoplasmatota archaeon]|nr:helix-turn-helix domain-containing protein [Candidatus Thermoplasmatota archaeon]
MGVKEVLAEKIAGEITLSPKPGETLRKWRTTFHIAQADLANHLGLAQSVISDYESGRRKSPGISSIKKIVHAFLEIDQKKHGGSIIQQYQSMVKSQDGIIEIMEYPFAIPIEKLIKEINGKVVTSRNISLERSVKGFTLIDGIETIKTLTATNYPNLYGWSTERALIFTRVQFGRSPMIAIRIHPVKPALVVYHQPGGVDPLAVQLAERENMPLVITDMPLEDLRKKLIFLGK